MGFLKSEKRKFKQPDAEDAKVAQKKYQKYKHKFLTFTRLADFLLHAFVFSFLRLLRNLCVFCVRLLVLDLKR
jgi:hypothetical protein